MSLLQILVLAVIQGAAELLPVSSSAHVIVAEKLMGLDPSAPDMTFLLVMLHTGTMFAVLFYFWSRWRRLKFDFFKKVFLATIYTGAVGLSLKILIEKVILSRLLVDGSKAEIEHLFKSLPLIALALFAVGILIIIADLKTKKESHDGVNTSSSVLIGVIQGLCLPFRGFSRSGATISTALLSGISQRTAEDFSFALAVILTPPVLAIEAHRFLKALGSPVYLNRELGRLMMPGFLGMFFSFGAGLLALYWLSAWLEKHRWKYFGIYCVVGAGIIMILNVLGF